MENLFISKLRDINTKIEEFRSTANLLAESLAYNSLACLKEKNLSISTPIADCNGTTIEENPLLVIILRSGMAMLPAFQKVYPKSKVAILGIYRDEKTFIPHLYYKKIPSFSITTPIFILDPMIATGNSLNKAIEILIKEGANPQLIHCFSFIGAKEGINKIKQTHPQIDLQIQQIDPTLNHQNFILPGLGDFGDRYFGTENN